MSRTPGPMHGRLYRFDPGFGVVDNIGGMLVCRVMIPRVVVIRTRCRIRLGTTRIMGAARRLGVTRRLGVV